jgi:hypothetical protein
VDRAGHIRDHRSTGRTDRRPGAGVAGGRAAGEPDFTHDRTIAALPVLLETDNASCG